MPRYIDAEVMPKDEFWDDLSDREKAKVLQYLIGMPTADVVPREETDTLEYTLMGVMHSVDKWLDGDELNQDEVNRAITMREKTLRIIENAKTEVAKEIFDEIERNGFRDRDYDGELFLGIYAQEYDEIKKKYKGG